MSNWRRQNPRNNKNNCYNHPQGLTTTQSSSKPPLANGKVPVPAWEKEFCAVVGSVPWGKVVEAKRFMHLYDRVVQWDDSAGEDAFKNAKSRFYAEINGLPCDLSIPDPDVYIDHVDWDAEVDTELILDLERGPEPITEEQEHVVILDPLNLLGYKGLGWGTGWGDAEGINEENVDTVRQENSWNDQKCDGWNEDSWVMKDTTDTWDHNNNSFKTEYWQHNNRIKTESWHHKKSNNNSFNQQKFDNWNGRDQGRESRGWRKKGEVQRGGGGDRVVDCRWRNGRGRSRGGFQQHSNGWGWTESF